VNIDETGKVTEVTVHKSSGSNEIDQPTLIAMYDWWFEPLHDAKAMPCPTACCSRSISMTKPDTSIAQCVRVGSALRTDSLRLFTINFRQMKLSELFYSIQGEGKLLGVPSVFVRASGCNLRCVWCDTPFASWQPEGHDLPIGQIVEQVSAHPTRHVVVTGGEPMIMPDIAEPMLGPQGSAATTSRSRPPRRSTPMSQWIWHRCRRNCPIRRRTTARAAGSSPCTNASGSMSR